MQAYATDLRKRLVQAVDEGRQREEINHLFGVSRATIKHYMTQSRETGELAPKSISGRPATKGVPIYGASEKPTGMQPFPNTVRSGKKRMDSR